MSSATLFHAAWGLVIAHTSAREDVVFGTVLLGRMQASGDWQKTLGVFINTLPLRLSLKSVSAKELVERTQRELIELLNHEQASLAEAQRCSGVPASTPLFTALLNYRHSVPDAQDEWAQAPGIRVLATQERTNYPLSLLGVVMIVLDSTVVNVALPSIRSDLGFSESSLVWVVNAYVLTFGGFLMLSGRLGDLYGARRLFLIGLVAFTLASVACGLATSQAPLIVPRAVQGIGGAIVNSVSLSLIINLFPEAGERSKAMGVYGFVCSAGGSLGVLLGGIVTTSSSWHWIFLINLPLGMLALPSMQGFDSSSSKERTSYCGATRHFRRTHADNLIVAGCLHHHQCQSCGPVIS